QQAGAALAFQSKRGFWGEDFDNVPLFSRTDQGRTILFLKIDMKITRAPQIPLVGITTTLFGPVNDLMNVRGSDGEGRFTLAEFHPQRRQPAARGSDLIPAFKGR